MFLNYFQYLDNYDLTEGFTKHFAGNMGVPSSQIQQLVEDGQGKLCLVRESMLFCT